MQVFRGYNPPETYANYVQTSPLVYDTDLVPGQIRANLLQLDDGQSHPIRLQKRVPQHPRFLGLQPGTLDFGVTTFDCR